MKVTKARTLIEALQNYSIQLNRGSSGQQQRREQVLIAQHKLIHVGIYPSPSSRCIAIVMAVSPWLRLRDIEAGLLMRRTTATATPSDLQQSNKPHEGNCRPCVRRLYYYQLNIIMQGLGTKLIAGVDKQGVYIPISWI